MNGQAPIMIMMVHATGVLRGLCFVPTAGELVGPLNLLQHSVHTFNVSYSSRSARADAQLQEGDSWHPRVRCQAPDM